MGNTIAIDICEACQHFTLAHWGYYCLLKRKCLDEMDSCPLEGAQGKSGGYCSNKDNAGHRQ